MKHSKILSSTMMVLGMSIMLVITSCEDSGGTSLKPLSSLTYSPSRLDATEMETITGITPTIVPEGATATYKVDPALPADLTLDPSSGAITGTPQEPSLSTQYTVTATGTGDYTGEVNAKITITVAIKPLSSLTYSPSRLDATEMETISEITPSIVPEGATATYTVDPALPADLTLDPSSGAIAGTPQAASLSTQYTVTATGTGDYTGEANAKITITVLGLVKVTKMAKTLPDEDRRYHYVAFTIESRDGSTDLGRYKFGLKASDQPKPEVDELKNGDGIYRIVNATVKPNVLAYTLDSGIKTFMLNAQNLGKRIEHDADTDVDSLLLRPGTAYILYGIEENGNTVGPIANLSTDVFDGEFHLGEGKLNDKVLYERLDGYKPIELDEDDKIFEGVPEYPYDTGDAAFIFPGALAVNTLQIDTIISSYRITPSKGTKGTQYYFFTVNGGLIFVGSNFESKSMLVPSLGGTETTGKSFVTAGSKTIGISLVATPTSELVSGLKVTHAYTFTAGFYSSHQSAYGIILDN